MLVVFHGILLSDTGSGAPNDGSSRSAGVSTGPSRRSARRIGQIRVAECSFIEQQDTPIQGNTPEVSSLNKVMDPGGGVGTHPHYGPQSLPLHSVTSNHASKCSPAEHCSYGRSIHFALLPLLRNKGTNNVGPKLL